MIKMYYIITIKSSTQAFSLKTNQIVDFSIETNYFYLLGILQ